MRGTRYVMQETPDSADEYLGWWVCSDGVSYGPLTREDAEAIAHHWATELDRTTWLEEV